MAIDTLIYGERSSWQQYANGGNTNPNLAVYCLPQYIASYSETPIGTPIDKSLSCSGLGIESVFSKIKWYDTSELAALGANGGGDATPTFTDVRTVSNWCFGDTQNAYDAPKEYGQRKSVIIDSNEDVTISGTPVKEMRYAPEPVSSWANPSNIKPITQFSHKNLVALIYVDVSDTLGVYATKHTYTLKEYIDTYTTTYPYIYGVSIRLFLQNTNETPISRMRLNSINTCGVSILDSVGLPKTKPYMYNLVTFTGEYIKIMGSFPVSDGSIYVQGSNNTARKTYIGACVADTWKTHIIDGDETYKRSTGYVYREYSDTFRKEVFTQVACFGILFTDDEQIALSGAIDDEGMYCGVLDDNLIGHGEFTNGEKNLDNEQIKWTNSNDSTYDPSYVPPYDPNIYGIPTSFNDVSLADGTLKRYALTDSDMENLGRYLWDVIDTTNPDELIQNQTLTNFLTNNPLDCIVGVKRFPFDDLGTGNVTNIILGKVTIPNTTGKIFENDCTIRTCGNYYVSPPFGDWRDFLCQYTLVLPFCGSISLNPEIITGKWIEVKYTIDYTTGTCTAWVLCQLDDGTTETYAETGVVIDSACGNCSIDIPVSGVQTADLNAQIYNANENLKAMKFNNLIDGVKGGMSFVGSIASGNKLAAITSGLNTGQDIVNSIHGQSVAEWNISNTQLPLKMIGASSGCNSFQHELRPRMIVYYPAKSKFSESEYAHTVGYACCETDKISSRNGYAEINNVNLTGFSATSTEKEMIQNLLSGGVYL